MPLPNFVLAGAPKSGTSSLWSYVRQHPDVFMPAPKEIAFFDYKYDEGLEWYRRKFKNHTTENAVGEATPWYMCDDRAERVPERMREVIPGAKLIFILRDPVDRARSNFQDDFRNGAGPISFTTTVSDFIRDPTNRSHTIIKCGYYYEHLRRFREYFNREQFLILLHKEFRDDTVVQRQPSFYRLNTRSQNSQITARHFERSREISLK